MEQINRKLIIALLSLKGIGRKTAFKIFSTIKDTKGISSLKDLFSEWRISNPSKDQINFSLSDLELAEARALEIMEESEHNGINVRTYYDEEYPDILRRSIDPPLLINLKGNCKILSTMNSIAVIGTRSPSEAGMRASSFFGETVALAGFNVISGLAIGCDSLAHQAAIKAKGITTAVLAHGLDTIYPKEHVELANDIIDKGGVLLSEYIIGTKVRSSNLIERDRIQAGLSKATIVIQTKESGGTMHAVNATINNDRLLGAVKYRNMEGDEFAGNRMLIHEKKAFEINSETLPEFLGRVNYSKSSENTNLQSVQINLFK